VGWVELLHLRQSKAQWAVHRTRGPGSASSGSVLCEPWGLKWSYRFCFVPQVYDLQKGNLNGTNNCLKITSIVTRLGRVTLRVLSPLHSAVLMILLFPLFIRGALEILFSPPWKCKLW
jgi:hypothetical protein